MRLTKYACRGFAVLCPGLDPASVDGARVRGTSFDALSGVARPYAATLVGSRSTTFEDAKKLMIQRFGMSVTFALSGIYDVPVHIIPGGRTGRRNMPWGNITPRSRQSLTPIPRRNRLPH